MPTQIDLLKKYELSVRGHSGQHILIDSNIQKKIVDLLSLEKNETVLEIGPGLGALTGEILRRGAKVIAVEKDEKFTQVLKNEYAQYIPRYLQLIQGDILKTDLKKILKKKKNRLKVISNLPYYITAPILFYLLDSRDLFSKVVLTMQREVALRLIAVPGSKDYGRLTLAVRYYADVQLAFHIAPSCFTPKPEVHSSVMVLQVHRGKRAFQGDDEAFFHLLKVAFQQRRKTLLRLLSRDRKLDKTRGDLTELFEKLRLPRKVRGEELLLKDYIAIAKELQSL